jgi:hypothetical protein
MAVDAEASGVGTVARDVVWTSTTLADFSGRVAVEASTAMRASLKRSKELVHDSVAYGRQAWLRWRSVDSFFPVSLARGGDAEGRHTRSLS